MTLYPRSVFSRLRHGGLSGTAAGGLVPGLLAAVLYGLIPTFTLPIHNVPGGGNPDALPDMSILFYRFGLAAVMLGAIMALQRRSFRITRGEAVTLIYLAFLSNGAAMFLLAGYAYMSTGIATTIHFMYPVVTAVIMMVFYHEARRPATIVAVVMAVGGVAALSVPAGGGRVELRGVVLELISAVCFALYLIRLNRSRVATMDNRKVIFYICLFGSLIFGAEALRQGHLEPLTTTVQVTNLMGLSFVCTVVTNLFVVMAVKRIGSTMVAVLGALEPLTAVVLGHLLFGEAVTWNALLGIALILPAVVIVIFCRRR